MVLRPKFPRSLGLWLILYRVTNGSPIVRKHFNLPRHRIDSVTEYRAAALFASRDTELIERHIAKYSFDHTIFPFFSCTIIKFNFVCTYKKNKCSILSFYNY